MRNYTWYNTKTYDTYSAKTYDWYIIEREWRSSCILAIEPNAVGAYNLLAIDAFNRREFKDAIVYWEKLLTFYTPGREEVKNVLDLIAKAQAAWNQ